MKHAILVIDVINDFVSGVFGSKRAASIVPNIGILLEHLRKIKIPIIYVTDSHIQGIDNQFGVWRQHAIEGTKGAQIVDEIEPKKGDYHLFKRRYSCFYETGLDMLLRELKVDAIVLTGLLTNICVQHTAADAFFRGYKIIVLRDCVESTSDEVHENSLQYMKDIYGATIIMSKDFINEKLGT